MNKSHKSSRESVLRKMPKPSRETAKFNFFDWNNKILVSSFRKIGLNILLIIVLDFLFYSLSGYLIIFWLQKIQQKMAAFNLPTDIASLGYSKMQQLANEANAFYRMVILSFILILIILIFLASILKGVIWAKTTNTKISFRLISKFLALNLIWMGFWFALIILISLLAEPASAPAFMVTAIIAGLYFTNTLYPIFMKKPHLKSIFSAVKLNIAKIHLFLLPYAVIMLLLYLLVQLGRLLAFSYSSLLTGVILIIYAAAVRYYVSALAAEVEKIR